MKLACFTASLVLVAACAPKGDDRPQACVSPAPPDGLDPLRDPAGAVQYARALTFLAGAPHGERRALTVITQPGPPQERRFGLSVEAEIQPEACSHLNDTTVLQGTRGRIVARIITTGPYPSLGLPADTSYLWVDSLMVRGREGRARGIVIPATAQQPAVRPVRFEYHPEIGRPRAWPEGRLVFRPDDDELWESCVMFGCCYLEEGGPVGPQ
jgi:hypothetical protein